MNCADCEILICDYLDGALAAQTAELERHLAGCPGCAALARDSAAARAFIERAERVSAPPELVTRILFTAPWNRDKPRQPAWRKGLAGLLSPVLQPKFAMGMAMTILSLSMLFRYISPVPASPARIWANLEDQGYRVWARTVKFYDDLKFVYQIQVVLRRWQRQQEEFAQPAAPAAPSGAGRQEKTPPASHAPPAGGAVPARAAGGNR